MFASALSSVTSALSSSVKDTASSYKFNQENIHGSFERLAQLGIANLSFRSPIIADIAEQVLKNFQLTITKKEKLREYVKSGESEELRKKVKSKLPETTSSKKIDEEMMRILEKLDKEVESSKSTSYKQSEFFKEYQSYFEKFKKDNATQESKSSPQAKPGETSSSTVGDSSGILDKIQYNTQRTFNAIEALASQMNVSGASGDKGSGQASFIDPMTGLPSMRAAIGSIGGSFLGKIFDDELISKYSNKVRSKLFTNEDGATEDGSTEGDNFTNAPSSESVQEEEKAKTTRSNELKLSIDSILDELLEIHKTIKLKTQGDSKPPSMFDKVIDNLEFPELSKRIPGAPKKTRTRTRAPRKVSTKVADIVSSLPDIELNKSPTINDTLGKAQGKSGYASKALNVAKGFGSRALSLLNPITKVAAAGAAGYAAGTVLNEGISSAIDWATDGESKSLGDWIYNKTHPSENAPQAKPKQGIVPITKLSEAKDNTEKAKTTTPIVLNTTNSNSTQPNQVIVSGTGPVRNKESTFERVQMQDFWPRSA